MQFRLSVYRALVLACLVHLSAAALAQTTDTSEVPSTVADSLDESRKAEAIPVAEIPVQAETANRRLRDIEQTGLAVPEVIEIEQALPGLSAEIERLAAAQLNENLALLTLRGLEDREQNWLRQRTRLDAWQDILVRRTRVLETERANLIEMESRWVQTRIAAAEQGLAGVLNARIDAVIEKIQSVRAVVRVRLETLLALQDRISMQLVRCAEAVAQIADAQRRARGALMRIDSQPLWRLFPLPASSAALRDQAQDSWTRLLRDLREFFAVYNLRLLIHMLFSALLFLLIDYLRRRSRRHTPQAEDSAMSASFFILSRPLSTATLLSLLAVPLIYPRAPVAVHNLSALLLVAPVLRLLPGLVYARLRPPVYALSFLFLLLNLSELAPAQTLLDRILLLGLTVLAISLLAWVLRPGARSASLDRSGWWQIALAATRLSLIVLGVALLSNVFGNLSLADLLTSATLNSAFLATGLLATVLVLEGVVAFLLRTRQAQGLSSIRSHGALVTRRGSRLLHLLALVVWIFSTLSFFDVAEPVSARIAAILQTRWTVGSVTLAPADLLAFFLSILIAVLLSRFVRFVLREDILPRFALPRGIPSTVSMLVHYGILALGFLFAIGAAGVDLTRFTIIAGALGVGVGFGLQNVVNNFVSGLILAFERPVQAGDIIEVGTLTGEVRRIGVRSSTIRTFDGAEVIVPNGNLIAAEVVNWTLSDRNRRIRIDVGVAYGSEPRRVIEILIAAASAHPDTLAEPEAFATFENFGDSALNFSLRFWTGNFDRFVRIRSEVTLAVHDALGNAGIVIPFPQRDLHLRSVDPDTMAAIGPARDS